MRRVFASVLIILVSISQTGIAQAGNKLSISYISDLDMGIDEDSPTLFSEAHLVGSEEALLSKKKMEALAKSSTTKANLITICKAIDLYKGRIKIVDARGGTAGLGYLTSVSVRDIKVTKELTDLPDYTEEQRDSLDEEYFFQEDYPDYKEDGYVYYQIKANCLFTGKVSVISSNAYRIYINGNMGPEYSKSELSKRKWAITLVDA